MPDGGGACARQDCHAMMVQGERASKTYLGVERGGQGARNQGEEDGDVAQHFDF